MTVFSRWLFIYLIVSMLCITWLVTDASADHEVETSPEAKVGCAWAENKPWPFRYGVIEGPLENGLWLDLASAIDTGNPDSCGSYVVQFPGRIVTAWQYNNYVLSVKPHKTANLSWTPPTLNTDGTPLDDLAGYKIYYGNASGDYPNVIDVADPAAVAYVIDPMTSGDWFFVMTAYDAAANESAFSNEATKTIP
jgi:hypothetical protein